MLKVSGANTGGNKRLISILLPKNQRACQIISKFLPDMVMYCPMGGSSQQINSRAINKSLTISSYVYHSSSLKQANSLSLWCSPSSFLSSSFPASHFTYPLAPATSSCFFPHRNIIGRTHTCLSTSSVTRISHLLELSASIFLCVSLLGCLWCWWYSWLRWAHVRLLILPKQELKNSWCCAVVKQQQES